MNGKNGKVFSDHWVTPRPVYDALHFEFNFDFDPCPLFAQFDGLDPLVEWGARNFVNPPYSLPAKDRFIMRASDETRRGKLSVLLIPVSTSSKIFHSVIYKKAEIRFLKGRLKFSGYNAAGELFHGKNAMFDSMVVIFRPYKTS